MKNAYLLLALFAGSPALVTAQDFNLDSLNLLSIGSAGYPAAAVYAPPPGANTPARLKKWTIIALVNGKNNLSADAEIDMNEMEAVGSTPDINVVVELGTMREVKDLPPVYNVRRYYVQKDADLAKISSPVLGDLKAADMGSWQHLAEFISWAKTNYPAERYMLVVWNHGSGWKSFGKPLAQLPAAGEKGISYDDQTNNHITAIEMAAVMARAGAADVFVSDACLMQELATNYELRKAADVIIASEETEPNEGQDYTRFLGALAAAPAADAEAAARLYIRAFTDSYAGTYHHTTISAVRAGSFEGLLPRVNAFSTALLAAGDIQFARDARRKTLKFTDPDAKDLGHFAQIVAEDSKIPAVREAAAALAAYIRAEVVIDKGFTGDFAKASGLAAYLPLVYQDADNYDQMSFASASSWTELIRAMKSAPSDADYWDDFPED